MPQNKKKRDAYHYGSNSYPGDPGYRTRDDRSGLDPLDTSAEASRMEGQFFRNLFTLKFRTRNPFYLSLMFIFGVIPFSLLFAATFETLKNTSPSDWNMMICPSIFTIVTGVLAINFILSVLEIKKIIPPLSKRTYISRPRKKKLPKHRKDYK